MTDDSNIKDMDSNQTNTVKIYSKKAVFCFSLFFAPIFGGVLLRQNLIDNNKKKEANIVLLISLLFTGLTILIVNLIEKPSFTYFINLGWGLILSEEFFKKYFPNKNYEYKKIWKALSISIIIVALLLLAIIYAPDE